MEETRAFGYVCPNCNKAVVGEKTKFALTAAACHVDCDCEKSSMEIQTDGIKFRMWVPCGFCGQTHQAEVTFDSVMEGRGIGLGCTKTHQICSYVGRTTEVYKNMEELAIRAMKEKNENPEAFLDNVIMYEILSEIKEIAARKGIKCSCGCEGYTMEIHRDSLDLCCSKCGGKLRIPAGTDEDLDSLCCQMTLTIQGRQ